MKKILSIVLLLAVIATVFTGCKTSNGSDSTKKANKEIAVTSREEGSGTRGAFIELFGIEQKDADGKKVDKTYDEAAITNSTSVMITTVVGNENAIGYISLGSLNDTVKALKIDGAQATVDNIKNDTYKISRPFNIATKGDLSAVAKDFIDFIMSTDGQKVVTDAGYISVSDKAYNGTKPSGTIKVAGSSSVTPVMEKLKEAYIKVNSNATIEIQQNDSSSGMAAAIAGTCDIGMASRDLKDSEKEKLTPTVIAKDGIAVIVNKKNPVSNLTKDQVMKIFMGEIKKWNDVNPE